MFDKPFYPETSEFMNLLNDTSLFLQEKLEQIKAATGEDLELGKAEEYKKAAEKYDNVARRPQDPADVVNNLKNLLDLQLEALSNIKKAARDAAIQAECEAREQALIAEYNKLFQKDFFKNLAKSEQQRVREEINKAIERTTNPDLTLSLGEPDPGKQRFGTFDRPMMVNNVEENVRLHYSGDTISLKKDSTASAAIGIAVLTDMYAGLYDPSTATKKPSIANFNQAEYERCKKSWYQVGAGTGKAKEHDALHEGAKRLTEFFTGKMNYKDKVDMMLIQLYVKTGVEPDPEQWRNLSGSQQIQAQRLRQEYVQAKQQRNNVQETATKARDDLRTARQPEVMLGTGRANANATPTPEPDATITPITPPPTTPTKSSP